MKEGEGGAGAGAGARLYTLSQKYRDFPKYATECSLEVVIWNGMVRGFFPNYVAGDFKVPLIVPHYC